MQRTVIKPVVLIVTGYLVTSIIALDHYLVFGSLSCLLGLLSLVFVLQVGPKGKRSYRFGWVTGVLVLLGILLPVKTILYFSIATALLFLVESVYGKTGWLPLLVLALISPSFQYLTDAFSFPIRLQLTKLAGSFFNVVGVNSVVKGNVIIQGAKEFSVDPGCMGLNMMQASLLLGIMLVVFYERRFQRQAGNVRLLAYFSLVILLNILANLFRILVLVHFTILPGTTAHEVIGIACLLVYVFVPAIFLAKSIVKGAAPVASQENATIVSPKLVWFHAIVLAAIVMLSVYVMKADTYKKVQLSAATTITGFSTSLYAPGIVKLQNNDALIYIKYIRGFYDTDHNPMICWKGSGYVFEQVQEQNVYRGTIYTGVLVNGSDKLYSAWWYTNNETITTSQWVWRRNMINSNKPHAVVNVTCSSKEELDKQVKRVTDQKILTPFFTNGIYQ